MRAPALFLEKNMALLEQLQALLSPVEIARGGFDQPRQKAGPHGVHFLADGIVQLDHLRRAIAPRSPKVFRKPLFDEAVVDRLGIAEGAEDFFTLPDRCLKCSEPHRVHRRHRMGNLHFTVPVEPRHLFDQIDFTGQHGTRRWRLDLITFSGLFLLHDRNAQALQEFQNLFGAEVRAQH